MLPREMFHNKTQVAFFQSNQPFDNTMTVQWTYVDLMRYHLS